jgi:hypothetical protein
MQLEQLLIDLTISKPVPLNFLRIVEISMSLSYLKTFSGSPFAYIMKSFNLILKYFSQMTPT